MAKQRLIFYLLLVGIILFNNWLLGFLFNAHLMLAGGSISELSALSQPHSIVFRLLDAASGLMLAGGFLLLTLDRPEGHQLWIARLGFVLGVANCIDALLPLPCSGTVDNACNWPVHINWQRISIPDHAFSSTVIGLLFLLIPILALRYAQIAGNKKLKLLSFGAILSILLFFGVLSTANPTIDRLTGFVQEAQLLIFSGLLVGVVRHISEKQKRAV